WLPRRLALAAVMLLPGLAAAAEGDANVLQTRATVAAMVEESIEMLEGQVSLEGVAGWAVFSGDPLSADLPAGVGMAERIDGEAHFLRTPDPGCLSAGYRHVLVFRDEDLFREFRQGELQGEALERSRS